MKHLKMSMMLLLTVAIFTSCEKETTTLPENAEMNVQEAAPLGQPGPKSILDIINSGIDLETYFNSLPKPENTGAKAAYSQIPNTNLQFFYNSEDLPCNNLPMEDFEDGNYDNYSFPNYLSENSNNDVFSPGDILPGISFELTRNYDTYNDPEYDYYDDAINNSGFFLWTSSYYGAQKVLMSNNHFTDLTINFSGNNITNVSMDLLNLGNTNVNIYIYGADDTLLGADVVYVPVSATFWAVQSLAPISKIVLISEYYYGTEGVDNVSFGACNDFDGDGVLNDNDLCANTPIGETVNQDGCAESQLDDDNDGVMNNNDQCSNTPSGEAVNENGCGQSQLDYDGDGVMNNKDAHIYSDLRTYINIGGSSLNIKNKMVKNGSTMMDQVNDLINEINSQYNGQNYAYLHKRFMTELSQITYGWIKVRLITSSQRSQISSVAWRANIPQYSGKP